jgi:sulfur-oxidizing protein SoxX
MEETIMLKKHAVAMLAIITGTISAGSAMAGGKDMTGKEIAYDRKLGNCLACHAMPNQPDAEMPGNIAPPLISMKLRYPDKAKLRAQIWDPMVANPQTSMPPFGKHKVLTEEEIDKVTDFVYSL